VTMATRVRLAAASAALLAVAGCASRSTVASRSSVVTLSPSASQPSSGGVSSPIASQPCVDPHPAEPKPVAPAVPNLGANGRLNSTWSLDGGQATIGPAGSAQPKVQRQQALCTLLAANDISNFDVLDVDSGFSLVLGKVTITDKVLATAEPVPGSEGVQQPPPPRPLHSRLAWIGVIDPPLRSTCGADGFASNPPPGPVLVPYQLLILDADTGTDGIEYEAGANLPCVGSAPFGPQVAALTVNVAVPWRLVSRDPGGLFATIAVSVTTCDTYAMGANTSRSPLGLVDLNVWRPIDACGEAKEVVQILRGPTVSDRLPQTLLHAALGFRDTQPESAPESAPATSVSPAALLCEESLRRSDGIVAAAFATTVGDLLSWQMGGPPPGGYPFAKVLASVDASAFAAWCETKTASGYAITAVGPDGEALGTVMTSPTFEDLSHGPPAIP
jgi:hypothetical protein